MTRFHDEKVKVLRRFLAVEEGANVIHGIKIASGALVISHLFFADNIMCFCRANAKELLGVRECIDTFASWSGLKINEHKLGLLWSRNVSGRIKRVLKNGWQLPSLGLEALYLWSEVIHERKQERSF